MIQLHIGKAVAAGCTRFVQRVPVAAAGCRSLVTTPALAAPPPTQAPQPAAPAGGKPGPVGVAPAAAIRPPLPGGLAAARPPMPGAGPAARPPLPGVQPTVAAAGSPPRPSFAPPPLPPFGAPGARPTAPPGFPRPPASPGGVARPPFPFGAAPSPAATAAGIVRPAAPPFPGRPAFAPPPLPGAVPPRPAAGVGATAASPPLPPPPPAAGGAAGAPPPPVFAFNPAAAGLAVGTTPLTSVASALPQRPPLPAAAAGGGGGPAGGSGIFPPRPPFGAGVAGAGVAPLAPGAPRPFMPGAGAPWARPPPPMPGAGAAAAVGGAGVASPFGAPPRPFASPYAGGGGGAAAGAPPSSPASLGSPLAGLPLARPPPFGLPGMGPPRPLTPGVAAPVVVAPPTPFSSAGGGAKTLQHFAKLRETFAAMKSQRERMQAQARAAGDARLAASAAAAGQQGVLTGMRSVQAQSMMLRAGAAAAAAAGATGTRMGVTGAERAANAALKATVAVLARRGGMFGSKAALARNAKLAMARRRIGVAPATPAVARSIPVSDTTTIAELARAMKTTAGFIMRKLRELGETGVHDAEAVVEPEVAEILVQEMGHKVKRVDQKRADKARTEPPSAGEMAAAGYAHRAPVVTVMGHVDHGKTTLMDALRGSNIAEREAGGITQGVAAFSVPMRRAVEGVGERRAPGGKAPKVKAKPAAGAASAAASAALGGAGTGSAAPAASSSPASPFLDVMTFLDTPGHALFSSMRRRGTAVTDVVVLVVDGRDGIMPQTKECVQLILDAGVPHIVAVTKVDLLPSPADQASAIDKIAKQLLALNLAVEGFGGEAPIIPISAKTGAGLQDLKDAISLIAEMGDLRANAAAPGEAVIIDSRMVKGTGVVCDAIVRWGTLKVGDMVIAGTEFGRVKALQTDATGAASLAKRLSGSAGASKAAASKKKSGGDDADGPGLIGLAEVDAALPGTPVRILGFKNVPPAGDDVLVVESEEKARLIIEGRLRRAKALEASENAVASSLIAEAERKEYTYKRQRRVAFQTALQRERRRSQLRAAGMPIPPELQLQPWEVAILREGRTGKIEGMDVTGKKLRTQGGQQLEMKISFMQAQGMVAAGISSGDLPATGVTGADGASVVAMGPKVIPLIVKADSTASLTAFNDAVARIPEVTEEVLPRVIDSSVGELSERDVQKAADMGAYVICFNSKVTNVVQKSADLKKVTIKQGRVIYHLLDEVCDLVADHLEAEVVMDTVAIAEVKAIFPRRTPKRGEPEVIAGCVIVEGTFAKSGPEAYRIVRGPDADQVAEVRELFELMHFKDKVETVKKGSECGVSFEGFNDFAVGDKIVAVKSRKIKPKLTVRFD